MVDFNNTRIAFHSKSSTYLRKAILLFSIMKNGKIVNLGRNMYFLLKKIHFPMNWVIRPTIYNHFVGGATLESCLGTVNELLKSNVKSILDYSAEGDSGEKGIKNSFEEILHSIDYAGKTPGVAYAVFKPSSMGYRDIMEKASRGESLDEKEQECHNQYLDRMDKLAERAYEKGVRLLVDAEHYAYQQCIDDVCDTLMLKYNKDRAVVFTTLQMYRHDRMNYLRRIHDDAKKNGFIVGAKFVRGAYMDDERELARVGGYPDPICKDKRATDNNYNEGLAYTIEHIKDFEVFNGTHNAYSNILMVELMAKFSIAKNDERIYSSQLYGMSDNLTFVLAEAGYNAVKYIPYAPIEKVIPYLLRRASENTSMEGQTSRELELLKVELKRRKSEGK